MFLLSRGYFLSMLDLKPSNYLQFFERKSNLSQVPRRASEVSALNVARLGLNDGAHLWISFKLFLKQTNPLLCKSLTCVIKKRLF